MDSRLPIAALMGALILAIVIGIWQGELPYSSINYTHVKVLLEGAPEIPKAFKYSFEIPHNNTLRYDNLKMLEEYIYKINETVFLYLGNYSFKKIEGWAENGEEGIVIMHLIKGKGREGLIIEPKRKVEVYASLEDRGALRFIPIFRVLDPEDVTEIRGYVNIENVYNVSLFLFPSRIIFNSTNDLRNGSKLISLLVSKEGKFCIRLDPELLKPPFPLREGPYLLIYGDMCKGGYEWLDINEIKGKTIYISLKCNATDTG